MSTLEGRLTSAAGYRSDDPVRVSFELTNNSDHDLYVLTWYTPLEGIFSDCLNVSRDGNRVPYDGLLPKRGTPTAENYVLVRAGQAVSTEFELSRAYEVAPPGDYNVALDTEVNDFFRASPAKSLEASMSLEDNQSEKQSLRDGATAFTVVPGEGRTRLTEGQAARRSSRAKKMQEAADEPFAAENADGLKIPRVIGGNPNQQAMIRQAHADGYGLCLQALATLANNDHYKSWFGAYTDQRFQRVRGNFTSIRDRMASETFTYIWPGAQCKINWHAYTLSGESRIWICAPFWSSPAIGANSKAGTVIHEHSHATARTADLIYGPDRCRLLAREDPERALRNAANHEYFAE